jgi:hypothetical protein
MEKDDHECYDASSFVKKNSITNAKEKIFWGKDIVFGDQFHLCECTGLNNRVR